MGRVDQIYENRRSPKKPIWEKLPRVFRLMSRGEIASFIALVVARIVVTGLDLLGMAFIGLSVSVAVGTTVSEGSLSGSVLSALRDFSGPNYFVVIAGFALLFFILKGVIAIFLNHLQARVFGLMAARKSEQVFHEILRGDLRMVRRWRSTDALYGLGESIEHSFGRTLASISNALGDISLLAAIVAVLAYRDFLLLLVLILYFGAIAFTLFLLLGVRNRKLGERAERSRIDLTSTVVETWENFRQIRTLSDSTHLEERFRRARDDLSRNSAKLFVLGGLPRYVLEIALMLGIGLVALQRVLFAGQLIAPDTLALFLAGSFRIAGALLPLQGTFDVVSQNRSAGQIGYEMLEEIGSHREREDTSLSGGSLQAKPVLNLRSVSYAHSPQSKSIISDLTFSVPFGSCLAITGPSGVGKSTLSDLILGLITPSSGEVSIGGLTAQTVLRTHRGTVAIVPQKISLIAGSWATNIALSSKFDADEVFRAAKQSGLESLINSERGGINSQVGDSERQLSGGELQRLGLARAIYQNPKILILDEFTSSLDAKTESLLIDTVRGLKGHCTVVVITHRSAPLVLADMEIQLVKKDPTILTL
jgi:ABC-type multidrug transport system fused ATPase/permease subunit